MTRFNKATLLGAVSAAAILVAGPSLAQQGGGNQDGPQPAPPAYASLSEEAYNTYLENVASGDALTRSVGRAWPIMAMPNPNGRINANTGELQAPGSTTNNLNDLEIERGIEGGQGPADGSAPPGWERLPRDIFNSDDYYVDRDLWSDPAYYRCNAPAPLSYIQGAAGPPRLDVNNRYETARWGDCSVSYPREGIVSPYPFATAQEHYEALMAETEANGGVTHHTKETIPDWSGRYLRQGNTQDMPIWFYGNIVQPSVQLSLLTPQYQLHQMQEWYHAANTNVTHWPAQYCWPEGFMRRYHGPGVRDHHLFMTHDAMLIVAGVADNFLTQVFFDREFDSTEGTPRFGADVPRWYGQSVGFWDEDVLTVWTSNIQGWMTHDQWEHSNQMQTVEIYDPFYDSDTGAFAGLIHETVFYDPEALVEPVRLVRRFNRTDDFTTADPFVFIECIQTIYPIEGRATPVAPGETIEYTVPDMFGRPWATLFSMFEDDMQVPEEGAGLFGFD